MGTRTPQTPRGDIPRDVSSEAKTRNWDYSDKIIPPRLCMFENFGATTKKFIVWCVQPQNLGANGQNGHELWFFSFRLCLTPIQVGVKTRDFDGDIGRAHHHRQNKGHALKPSSVRIFGSSWSNRGLVGTPKWRHYGGSASRWLFSTPPCIRVPQRPPTTAFILHLSICVQK